MLKAAKRNFFNLILIHLYDIHRSKQEPQQEDQLVMYN